ncbi:hypothetical protein EDB81DRAFT_226172 [Dactylonectria macrodidyma]|uniref:NACHT domain-containing protein n=1 Tax=Dactylonectria macrodidyma TaxID=307937 RepID=A0A9P9DQ81_9HYPO|nr:hypothetical protein EDB81DRAFT_226172 [Dactylonectria macrodidyma]
MDPFTSLSIATSVITIVDLAAKLIVTGREIHKSGSTLENEQAKCLSMDLRQLITTLHSTMKIAPSAETLRDEEQKLINLGDETAAVADELALVLEYVEQCGGKRQTLKSVRQALRATAMRKKVSDIMNKLDSFKNELVLRLVVSLKLNTEFHAAQSDERYRTLETETRRIADALLNNSNFFTTGIGKILRESENESRRAQIRHEETIAAMTTLRGTLGTGPFDLHEDGLQDLDKIQEVILNFLWFRFMRDREMEVADAYGSTFQWAFSPDMSGFEEWNRLSTWLREGTGCYWVNGKAGSGKSTFLKFLVSSSRTTDLLAAWADGRPIRCASFFFWASGGIALQRSQEGLLRSILYEILSQHPELIPVVFPVLSRKFARQSLVSHEPSLVELKEAFKLLASQTVSPGMMCLFVDGVDECAGDHLQLVDFLRSTASPNVKIVMSSRPTPTCEQAFNGCVSIKLQLLTRGDMETYIRGNLASYSGIAALSPSNAHLIIATVVDKSCGVFLWVSLVCKAMRMGLANFSRIDELLKLVDGLPTDLDKLYSTMFKDLDPRYRNRLFALLRIMYHASKSSQAEKMTVVRLAYAMDDNPDAVIDAKIEPIGDNDIRLCRQMRGFVQGHSCGLLEIQTTQAHPVDGALGISPTDEVGFLHKSVVAFLEKEDIWTQIHSQTSTDTLHPGISLLCALIREIKTSRQDPRSDYQYRDILTKARCVLHECAWAEALTGNSEALIMEELEEVMHSHWQANVHWRLRHGRSSIHWFTDVGGYYSSSKPPFDYMLFLAARHGLVQYVKDVLERAAEQRANPEELSAAEVDASQIVLEGLFYANDPRFDVQSWQYGLNILDLCIEHGADLRRRESVFLRALPRSPSAWHRALNWEPTDAHEWQVWLVVLQKMLEADVFPDLVYTSWVNAYWGEFERRLNEVHPDYDTVRICQKPLAVIRDRYAVASDLATSRSSSRRIRLLYEKMRRNFLEKRCEDREWAEVLLQEDWKVVQDTELAATIVRAHRLSIAEKWYR